MVSLQTVILCSSIALFALVLETNAGTHHYQLPGKNVTHTYQYKKNGTTNVHTYRYKKPGKNVTHTYQYKNPGQTNTHTYQYKKPGTTNTHKYHYGTPGSGTPGSDNNVSGVYYIINMIYNYFAVGGRLTGIPPMDLTLLRYYVAQGPKNFCPKQ